MVKNDSDVETNQSVFCAGYPTNMILIKIVLSKHFVVSDMHNVIWCGNNMFQRVKSDAVGRQSRWPPVFAMPIRHWFSLKTISEPIRVYHFGAAYWISSTQIPPQGDLILRWRSRGAACRSSSSRTRWRSPAVHCLLNYWMKKRLKPIGCSVFIPLFSGEDHGPRQKRHVFRHVSPAVIGAHRIPKCQGVQSWKSAYQRFANPLSRSGPFPGARRSSVRSLKPSVKWI